ncbi:hypothetical protein DES38_10216 [Streptohalobacillus salinus]|uniref:Calcineurin-like phosphoesterase domain-containing protein n=1 Tax=Streptohalobacillus salinus TaxID=621096 RepID=A0A2V3WIQ9_9BACI|nr:metallophosphoesterase [Streptohalobacillus salinus]PXW92438.1 hypothetical protein DES38_10216 [Streptohalobacillus salinus]
MIKRVLQCAGVLAAALLGYTYYHDTYTHTITHIEISTDKFVGKDSVKLVQLSDLHGHMYTGDLTNLAADMLAVSPDLIVLTGDMIDRKTEDTKEVVAFIRQLVSSDIPVYFVSGNHEHSNLFGDRFVDALVEEGVQVLNNAHVVYTKENVSLNLIGIDDVSTGQEQMAVAFNDVDRDNYSLLLSHAPDVVTQYKTIEADLILSGHTHGGQVRLPVVGALVAPTQGYFPYYDKGLFNLSEGQYIYVDSGIGTSQLRLRLFNQSQFSIIEITSKQTRTD